MQIIVKKKDAIWNLLGTILSMGANLIILPFILYYLTDDDVAIYYIFTSLAGIAALFDFGFSPSVARSMTYAFSGVNEIKKTGAESISMRGPNYSLMKRLISTCKVIYFSLSLIALLLALSLGSIYVLKVSGNKKGMRYLLPWIIYAFSIFLNILFGYYSVFLRGVGAVAEINMASIISRIVQIVMSIGLLFFGWGLCGVAVAYLFYGLAFRLVAKRKFYKYQEIGKQLDKVSRKTSLNSIKDLLSELWPNTWRDGLVTLSNYLVGQATTIIASAYLTLTETGILSLCVQLVTAVATVATVLLTVYQPAMQSSFVNKDKERQRSYLSTVIVFYCSSFTVIILAVAFIGLPIISWLKPSYQINIKLLLIVSFYYFVLYLRNTYCSFISCTNRLIYSKSFVVASVLCVIFQLIMGGIFKTGVYGIVWGQIFSQLVFCAWYWPRFVHYELQLSFVDTVKMGIAGLFELVKGNT